jgi:uncharacterized protein (DUF302 family)
MKKTFVSTSVDVTTEHLKQSLIEKGFTLFCDVDHQKNAELVELALAPSRVLIFGNPQSGTKLMQADITACLDLPLRIAVTQVEGKTIIIHPTSDDFTAKYALENHPVLDKIDGLFSKLITEVQDL